MVTEVVSVLAREAHTLILCFSYALLVLTVAAHALAKAIAHLVSAILLLPALINAGKLVPAMPQTVNIA